MGLVLVETDCVKTRPAENKIVQSLKVTMFNLKVLYAVLAFLASVLAFQQLSASISKLSQHRSPPLV